MSARVSQAAASMAPEIPGLVFRQPLGSGGYADVYLYEQQMPRMPVAVKVLKAEGMTAAIRRQFSDEADTMAQLADHPYIVQVFLSGTSGDGRPYLVMKYYPPPNLAARARTERFTVEEVLRTGIQLASAVETAHRAGVIHRDIKPANVLVSQYGAPGLTDFGIAGRGRALEDDHDDEVGVSVPWAPPEVLFGHSNGGSSSDVYSLAATLWQLLVGRSPFEMPGGDNTALALMPRIRSTPVPSTGRADVPASLERLLAQAMSKDEHARPETALAFARALQEIEQEQRFARTAIVVLDEQGHTTVADQGARSGDDTDQTRVKSPQSVYAQRTVTPARPGVPSLSGGTVIPPSASPPIDTTSPRRPVRPQSGAAAAYDPDGADEGTVRVKRQGQSEVDQGPGGGGLTIGPGVLLGVIGVLVIALAVVAVIVFGGRDASDTPTGPINTVTASQSQDDLNVPTVPIVTADSQVGKVAFSWTYDGAQAGDTYRLRVGIDPGELDKQLPRTVSKPSLTVATAKGKLLCAQVSVSRAGATSAYSTPVCERAR